MEKKVLQNMKMRIDRLFDAAIIVRKSVKGQDIGQIVQW